MCVRCVCLQGVCVKMCVCLHGVLGRVPCAHVCTTGVETLGLRRLLSPSLFIVCLCDSFVCSMSGVAMSLHPPLSLQISRLLCSLSFSLSRLSIPPLSVRARGPGEGSMAVFLQRPLWHGRWLCGSGGSTVAVCAVPRWQNATENSADAILELGSTVGRSIRHGVKCFPREGWREWGSGGGRGQEERTGGTREVRCRHGKEWMVRLILPNL